MNGFLKVLRECKDAAIQRGRIEEGQRFSDPMQRSWESGDFWIAYAARKNLPLMLSSGRSWMSGSLARGRGGKEMGGRAELRFLMRRRGGTWTSWWNTN